MAGTNLSLLSRRGRGRAGRRPAPRHDLAVKLRGTGLAIRLPAHSAISPRPLTEAIQFPLPAFLNSLASGLAPRPVPALRKAALIAGENTATTPSRARSAGGDSGRQPARRRGLPGRFRLRRARNLPATSAGHGASRNNYRPSRLRPGRAARGASPPITAEFRFRKYLVTCDVRA